MSSSVFGLQMEKYHGDLNDIVRASAHPLDDIVPEVSWQQQFPSDPLDFSSSSAMFGDPFSAIRDPLLLHELNVIATGSGCGSGSSSTFFRNPNIEDTSNFSAGNTSTVGVLDDMTSPCNIFSRIQISQSSSPLTIPPCDPPAMAVSGGEGHKAPAVFPSDMINAKGFLNIDKMSSPVQISSPRTLGIKKRKSQAKKVVCIPAPAAANSRSSGEVVPSDLWAWRKYGQKPIKGSPYPRGYYRCSSSKGCSARKQVERSRTDPNMLVITYTSEHNHPWPTQRNALAGSSRSQSSKTNASKLGSPSNCHPRNDNDGTATTSVKEEIEMEDHEAEFGEGIPQTYRPAVLPESSQQQYDEDNFFADLDEIEIDPLNLLFQGDHEQKENKPLDPFSLFDWSGNNSF